MSLLSTREFAQRSGVPWGTVKRWCHEGMPVIRPDGSLQGRVLVDPATADPWVAEHSRYCTFDRKAKVYFAQATAGGPIKIGWTSDVARRLKELAKGKAPTRYVALLELDGDKRLESELHARFAAHRVDREWFEPAPDLLVFIAERRAA